MKKLLLFSLILLILIPHTAFAREDFITLFDLPYSSHVLGEKLVIYGDTNMQQVTLGLYYPKDQGYGGYAKYIMTIPAKELKNGYIIPTEPYSRTWPEGDWTVVVQNGEAREELTVTMTKEAVFDRVIKIAEYENSVLTNLTSYYTRGVFFKDNILSFTLKDNTLVKIFSWDNLSPTHSGNSRIYVTYFNDGYLTDVKTYRGYLSSYGNYISLAMEDDKLFKLFYWNENLTPQNTKAIGISQ